MGDWFNAAQSQYDNATPAYLEAGDVCERRLVSAWGHCDAVCGVHDQPWPCRSGDDEDEQDDELDDEEDED